MARGVNRVTLIGHLGADPEVRNTSGGMTVTNLRLATSEQWKDRQSGERQERTEWHRIVMFARLAEIAAEYLRKGSLVYIEGRLQTKKWQDQNGIDRWSTEVVAQEMQMLGDRQARQQRAEPEPKQTSWDDAGPKRSDTPGQEFDDDIPF